jgi:hypothetical protein
MMTPQPSITIFHQFIYQHNQNEEKLMEVFRAHYSKRVLMMIFSFLTSVNLVVFIFGEDKK